MKNLPASLSLSLSSLVCASLFFGCATTSEKSDSSETDSKAAEEKTSSHEKTDEKTDEQTHEYVPDAPKKGQGHGGHHRFDDPEKWALRFENPERDAWQKPDEVIAKLSLSPSAKVADIGSATGYFDVRLAKAVPEGQVWGIDLEETMVAYLNKRAEKEGLTNLKSVQGAPSNPNIPQAVDLILVVNTYHHIEDRSAYFKRLTTSLRPEGRVAIVDFKTGDLPFGPPNKMKLAPEKVIAEMAEAGFVVDIDEREMLPHQYMLTFKVAE